MLKRKNINERFDEVIINNDIKEIKSILKYYTIKIDHIHLNLAIRQSNRDVFELLYKHCYIKHDPMSPLTTACIHDKIDIVEYFIDTCGYKSDNYCMIATGIYGHYNLIKYLYRHCENIDLDKVLDYIYTYVFASYRYPSQPTYTYSPFHSINSDYSKWYDIMGFLVLNGADSSKIINDRMRKDVNRIAKIYRIYNTVVKDIQENIKSKSDCHRELIKKELYMYGHYTIEFSCLNCGMKTLSTEPCFWCKHTDHFEMLKKDKNGQIAKI